MSSTDGKSGIVVGIDGGGSYSRAMAVDMEGNMLAYSEQGPASIYKDTNAAANVQQVIRDAVDKAGCALDDIRAIAAGIAGYDAPSDREWVEALTAVEGINCSRWHFNDTVAAHYGALTAQPGIIAIAGTGSNILAVTEEGRMIRNYDAGHYAASAARFLSYDAVHEALAGLVDESDQELAAAMLQHWGVTSDAKLRELAWNGWMDDVQSRNRQFGMFAPRITKAALRGSTLARRVCDKAVDQMATGIGMLGAAFADETVQVSYIGSVINSEYIKTSLTQRLAASRVKQFNIVEPVLPPVAGAALYALNRLLGEADREKWITNLQKNILSHSQSL
ncbi:N-acetylglucosamine kinase [Paenibacillus sp. CCS19]|uniref:N-acetylglucosamine kinase n=1 Tax=Paenibacillus sp. CCS19 TaxID=3158387 RepID=UPI002562809E|nr:BadF/BadG/BcrA/BcrD ATPase family protein [Paenibacillus cellulosilyticus]GMK41976.1 N-acetylglucosamine kinase [Paenibacillus cellulosilyticus]